MKQVIQLLILLTFLSFSIPAKADIVPLSSKSINYYGIGVLNMPKSYNVYENPDKNSKIIKQENNIIKKSSIVRSSGNKKMSYIAYVPSNNIALLAVDYDGGNHWYSVYTNQATGEKGWVYDENDSDFYTYREMFYKWGKPYGLRIFNDINESHKSLYSKEDLSSKAVSKLELPKFTTFTIIRGNWMLATVQDLDKQPKVGWFNWRNEDGTLNMFPNFREQR